MMRCFFVRLLLLTTFCVFGQSKRQEGEQLLREMRFSEAKTIFLELYAKNPEDLRVVECLGDIEGHSENWQAALVYYRKLRNAKPQEADYQYKYGGVLGMIAKGSNRLKALSMIGDIRAAFLEAARLDPKHIDARWALVELYLQLPGIVGGSEKKAIGYANQLSAISAVDGMLAKGRIAEYFERYQQAEQYYITAVNTGGSKNCYQKLADLYKNKLNKPEKARLTMAGYHKNK